MWFISSPDIEIFWINFFATKGLNESRLLTTHAYVFMTSSTDSIMIDTFLPVGKYLTHRKSGRRNFTPSNVNQKFVAKCWNLLQKVEVIDHCTTGFTFLLPHRLTLRDQVIVKGVKRLKNGDMQCKIAKHVLLSPEKLWDIIMIQ